MLFTTFKSIGLTALLLYCTGAAAQQQDTLLTLRGAVSLATANYHNLQARKYEAAAAGKEVAVARYGKLPTIEASYQAGLGTANNLIGMFYPGGILPMTGPPSATNQYTPATSTAAGLLLNWQAITFGEQDARIGMAKAEASSRQAVYNNEVLIHSINVISAYLDILFAEDEVLIHRHNIARVQANLRESKVLAGTGVKPGVDSVLFLAELSKARVALTNAQRQLETGQWQLARLLAVDQLPVPADTDFLQSLPTTSFNTDSSLSDHPLIQLAQSELSLNQSKEKLLKRSYLPKLTVWGTGFARGSGFENDGMVKTWDGMGLSRYNYGAGLQLSFPVMKYGEVKRQLRAEALRTQASQERIAEDRSALSSQAHIAAATFASSLAVARETVLQMAAGQKAFNAMQIRYKTGLVSFTDLIQTQYNLLSAELEVKQSCLEAWKALLLQAAVQGDIAVFLHQIK